ncbi:MAG: hypothetical protein SFV15_14780 [Polyangiaceae bacterium]|nr:hypothetical protein [Polyangiaceae bacterium]
MYDKGIGFVGAAMVVGKHGHRYVVLHLLCQGLELLGKSFLLFRDYNKYDRLLRKHIGHDLEKLVHTLGTEFGLGRPSKAFANEMKQLNALYKNHRLRYGSVSDMMIDPRSIPFRRVLGRLKAAIRVANPQLPSDVVRTAADLGMRP